MTPNNRSHEGRVAYSVPEWAARYGIGKSKAYALIRTGQGPRTVRIGADLRITVEADEAWRRSLHAERDDAA